MKLIELSRDVDISRYTLIIPSVSVGNVPQFTVDLLIKNYNFEKVGMIWHAAIIPLVGADPYNENSDEICTACELFVNENLKIAALQIRTSFQYKMLSVFLEDLKADIIKHKINRIVLVSSAFDYELHKIDRGKYFYIDNTGSGLKLEQIGFKLHDKHIVPGGGYCTQVYEAFKEIAHCTVLIKYVSEGNNTNDAVSMMMILSQYISNLKELNINDIKVPHSWGSVFGSPPPMGMF